MKLAACKTKLVILSATLLLAACTTSAQAMDSQRLPAQAACFLTNDQSITVSLEWAQTADQKRIGLMGREFLEERSGMLFNYSSLQPATNSFWMRNTLIALDIAYVDQQGVIVAINQMEPCTSVAAFNCPIYPAGAEYVRAVEMNAGFFSRYQITLGDRLQTNPALCASEP